MQSSDLTLIVIILTAIAFVPIYFYGKHLEKLRRLEMGRLARKLKLSYSEEDNEEQFLERFEVFFAPFNRGGSKYAHNCLTGSISAGKWSIRTFGGDYHYETGSGKNRKSYDFSFFVFKLPARLPAPISILGENFLDKIAGAMGFEDIDFESEEFSRRFHVKSEDKKYAYALLEPRMMEFLLRNPPPNLLLRGDWICLWTEKIWEDAEFLKYVSWIEKFYDLWPRHLLTGNHNA